MNLPLPVPFNPGSHPVFFGSRPFAFFRLQNIVQCCIIFPFCPASHHLGNPASRPLFSHLPSTSHPPVPPTHKFKIESRELKFGRFALRRGNCCYICLVPLISTEVYTPDLCKYKNPKCIFSCNEINNTAFIVMHVANECLETSVTLHHALTTIMLVSFSFCEIIRFQISTVTTQRYHKHSSSNSSAVTDYI